jgi:hypothetical protein
MYQPAILCILAGLYDQREGMGPLEHQAKPSLRDVAHDGDLCTISNRSTPDRDTTQGVWPVRAGGMDRPSHHAKITPCCVTLLQLARRAAVLDQLSSFRPHLCTTRVDYIP